MLYRRSDYHRAIRTSDCWSGFNTVHIILWDTVRGKLRCVVEYVILIYMSSESLHVRFWYHSSTSVAFCSRLFGLIEPMTIRLWSIPDLYALFVLIYIHTSIPKHINLQLTHSNLTAVCEFLQEPQPSLSIRRDWRLTYTWNAVVAAGS